MLHHSLLIIIMGIVCLVFIRLCLKYFPFDKLLVVIKRFSVFVKNRFTVVVKINLILEGDIDTELL